MEKLRYVCHDDAELLSSAAGLSRSLKYDAMRKRETRNSREIRGHRIDAMWSAFLAGEIFQLKLSPATKDYVPIQQISLNPLEMKVLDQARQRVELAAATAASD